MIFHPDKVEEHLKIAYTEHFKKIVAAKDLLLAHLVNEKLELEHGVGRVVSVVNFSTQFGLHVFYTLKVRVLLLEEIYPTNSLAQASLTANDV